MCETVFKEQSPLLLLSIRKALNKALEMFIKQVKEVKNDTVVKVKKMMPFMGWTTTYKNMLYIRIHIPTHTHICIHTQSYIWQ